MEHAIRIEGSVTRAMPIGRLDALKERYVSTPNNQQQLRDGDVNKIMNRDLYVATEDGDVEKFTDALEKVSESRKLALSLILDQVTPSGNSLLHVAASSGRKHVVELILIHFPYLMTRKNSSDDTPLHVAIRTGSLEATRELIRLRRDSEIMYWKNKDSKSPLYLAAENCNFLEWKKRKGAGWEIVQLLLQESARDEAYAEKIQGMSPVLAALGTDKSGPTSGILREVVDRLPKLLHLRNEDGGTPLHSAASVGYVWAADFILERCPDLALQTDKNGSYPIHIACQGSGYFKISELMEGTWPDLAEIRNNKGQNILHVAAKAGNNRAVRCILEECSEAKKLVNSKDVDGNTPLHLASMHNHCRVMLSLTSSTTPDVELRNNGKLTALDVAMESESLSMEDSPLLGRALLIAAGVPRSKGRDTWPPREQSSNASKSSRVKWMKDQVNTRLLVATLVATVTFAAGFTFPGGYNASTDRHPGTATMLHHGVFQLFVISNMLATYSSILAVVVLLWGHVTDFYIAELAYLSAGPLLLMALTSMTVAFMAAIIVAVRNLTWLAFLVLYIALGFLGMFIMVLAALVFPFSRIAMRIVSLYYMAVVFPRYAVGQFKKIKWGHFFK